MSAKAAKQDHRHFSRIPFEASVEVSDSRNKWYGKLLDISLQGLLITLPHNWSCKPGDRLQVQVNVPGGAWDILMESEVAHRESDSVGLHCVSIDLDSMTHLRRLVELNLGDESILQREFKAMVAAHG